MSFPRDLRVLRELLCHRMVLTGMRSAVKNRVHAIFAKHGITRQHFCLFGKGAREFVAQLEFVRGSTPAVGQPDVADRGLRLDHRDHQGRSSSERRPRTASTFLTHIRGVGRCTAVLIIAEVGEIERFPDARAASLRVGRAHTDCP